jgi:uncharacterized sulfatase
VVDEAIKLLQKHKDKPFFIAAGFYKPHCPWITPSKYFDLYNMGQMKLPQINDGTRNNYPELALASTKPWPYFGLNTEQARECKLAYYAAISFVDAQIGRLLDAVNSLGLSDNTIIVFWSDHGYQLGEHGLWFKQSLFEEASKSPLIISVPGVKSAGKICHRTVEFVDIYPTLAELTGLTPPADLQGYSLSSLLQNPEAEWKHPAFTQVQRGKVPGHSIRTEQWRYTEWDFGKMGTELYDELKDPKELNNLSANSKYADAAKKMEALLHKDHPKPVTGGQAVADTKNKYSN